MSNKIDHDVISDRVEKLFEQARELSTFDLENKEPLKNRSIKFNYGKIELVDDEMIIINSDFYDISILRDPESRTTKIYDIKIDEVRKLSEFNTSDDPGISVYLGNSANDCFTILKTIDNANEDLRISLKNLKSKMEENKPVKKSGLKRKM